MHPILFNVGETPIHAYGFLIAVALILGWVISLRLARADKLPADLLGTAYVLSVGAGLLGAATCCHHSSASGPPVRRCICIRHRTCILSFIYALVPSVPHDPEEEHRMEPILL